MTFCSDPGGYHDHSCPGYSLERIADLLERVADALDPSEERVAQKIEQAQRIAKAVVAQVAE